jgi:hypothetical protein
MDRLGPDVSDAATAPQVALLTPRAQPDAAATDAWLACVVPVILGSPAYADGGSLVIAFEQGGPALVVSPFVASGETVDTGYDHYALQRTLARIFGVEPSGRAARKTVEPFGDDVWAAVG